MTNFVNTEIEINKARVFKRLKIKEGTTAFVHCNEIFDALCSIAKSNMQMVNLYSVRDNSMHFDIKELDDCQKIVLCFTSCNNKILDEIDALMEQEDYLEGYILNDIANEVLFNASRQMNLQIYNEIKSMGFNLTTQYSPGENNMCMEYQKDLLDALKEEIEIDAYLTDSYMINPEKSMLYVYGADKNIDDISIEHDCSKCSNKDCFFRIVD